MNIKKQKRIRRMLRAGLGEAINYLLSRTVAVNEGTTEKPRWKLHNLQRQLVKELGGMHPKIWADRIAFYRVFYDQSLKEAVSRYSSQQPSETPQDQSTQAEASKEP